MPPWVPVTVAEPLGVPVAALASIVSVTTVKSVNSSAQPGRVTRTTSMTAFVCSMLKCGLSAEHSGERVGPQSCSMGHTVPPTSHAARPVTHKSRRAAGLGDAGLTKPLYGVGRAADPAILGFLARN